MEGLGGTQLDAKVTLQSSFFDPNYNTTTLLSSFSVLYISNKNLKSN